MTGEDGRFRFETGRIGRALLTIESPEFERHVKELATEQRGNEDLEIVLSIRSDSTADLCNSERVPGRP